MDSSVLQNPTNPFTVFTYVISYALLLGYIVYVLWRYRKG